MTMPPQSMVVPTRSDGSSRAFPLAQLDPPWRPPLRATPSARQTWVWRNRQTCRTEAACSTTGSSEEFPGILSRSIVVVSRNPVAARRTPGFLSAAVHCMLNGRRAMRPILRGVVAAAVIGGLLALWKAVTPNGGTFDKVGTKMKTRTVHVVIDAAAVASATDAFSLIEPLWERVDIYGSWVRYEATLRPFTISQRHLFAIQWYRAEVNNGGHDQFFGNSTGIVCEHAVEALGAVGLADAQAILKSASARLGGASRDRTKRESQLEAVHADFEDLDDRFYEIEETGAFDERMLAFARQHAADFRFDGTVERLILPQSEDAGPPN